MISNNDSLLEKLRFIQMSVGAVPSPFDCWLVQRSLKTLAVRMERHCENAMEIANFLEILRNSGAYDVSCHVINMKKSRGMRENKYALSQ